MVHRSFPHSLAPPWRLRPEKEEEKNAGSFPKPVWLASQTVTEFPFPGRGGAGEGAAEHPELQEAAEGAVAGKRQRLQPNQLAIGVRLLLNWQQ